MTTPVFVNRVVKFVKSNSPAILTGLGAAGVVGTAYLTGKASFEAARLIDEDETRSGISENPRQRLKERTKLVWKLFIPAGASGVATLGCIFGLQSVSSRRTTAAATAYAIAERGFAEYREQVVEQFGKGPEQKVRDKIAQKKIEESPPSAEVVYVGAGHVLCCELYTGRYFRSDMEALKSAVNEINSRVIAERYVPLGEFYDLVDLQHTCVSSDVGWDSDKLMELKWSTCLSPDKEPCIAFEYNYVKPL